MEKGFSNRKEVFIVSEIGNNHEGDFNLAQDMIRASAEAGVDAVKFQTCNPKDFITFTDQKRIRQLTKFKLKEEQIISLAKQSKELGLIFFSTPLDIESAKFLNKFQEIFKVSSGDNNFINLIDTIFNFNKATIISTGLADIKLLDNIYTMWRKYNCSFELAFMHCVSSYPVPVEQANLGAIKTLKQKYPDLVIGYSDHTIGIESCCVAVSTGAKIIEKHFTLDKNYSDFRDHQLSADPNEMKELVQKIRHIEKLLGNGEKKPQECEKLILNAMRRSIAASHDIPQKTILKHNDLTWLRPGIGFSPGEENKVIGKTSKREIKQGEILNNDMFL